MVSPVIFWFRRDLRLSDNRALVEAARRGDGDVVAVFVIDPQLAASVGPARGAYLSETLRALDASLEGQLVLRRGEPSAELAQVARATGARQVIATEDFAPAGRSRDARVRSALASAGITTTFFDSAYVVRPGTVRTKTGTPCKVFTSFRRGWENEEFTEPLGRVAGVNWVRTQSVDVSELSDVVARRRPEYFGALPDDVPHFDSRVGETGAGAILQDFVTRVGSYDETRNLPGVTGTSRLSAHLRFGTLHPRQVLAATNGSTHGAEVFRAEICWREFYADVLLHHPDSTWRELQPAMAHLRVDRDDAAIERFQRWARGETGYPLVDAGMRQLLAEGWMHNRVRMVCASFLVKHLHLDWRWGAQWFMWRLIDGDVASNQHGWQWSAGTGTDASPFHRIFNPTLQAERFDPEGRYVRQYVTELATVAAPQCLQPGAGDGLFAPTGYVAPMIDAATERDDALVRFREAREFARTTSREDGGS
ncbi:MAG: deoxyribodipyrimidine photo-lyase [Acidimicrobiaceae bacterium]|nr:deoxyribodipyrimidine photo-lyase [Acidimicrobiaceae bacterium]